MLLKQLPDCAHYKTEDARCQILLIASGCGSMMSDPIRTTTDSTKTDICLVFCHKRMNVISSTQSMKPDLRRLPEGGCREYV